MKNRADHEGAREQERLRGFGALMSGWPLSPAQSTTPASARLTRWSSWVVRCSASPVAAWSPGWVSRSWDAYESKRQGATMAME
jgi:hypothetical protein